MVKKNKLQRSKLGVFAHIFFIIFSIICIIPFLLLISISLSEEKDIIDGGFSLIPKHFSLDAYKYVASDLSPVLRAYGVTAIYAVAGTFISIVFMAGVAYALARKTFRYKNTLTVFLLITMLFGGGLTASYIFNTQVYHLGDTIWIYLINGGTVSAYNIFVFRTFFKSIPESLIESANLDGASEFCIMRKIMIPLSTPVLATFSFMGALGRWNDVSISLYYISDSNLYTLQLMLQNILNQAEYLKQLKATMSIDIAGSAAIPTETMKFAMCIIAAGPMIFCFPFFQKYLAKGIVVGAVKG